MRVCVCLFALPSDMTDARITPYLLIEGVNFRGMRATGAQNLEEVSQGLQSSLSS